MASMERNKRNPKRPGSARPGEVLHSTCRFLPVFHTRYIDADAGNPTSSGKSTVNRAFFSRRARPPPVDRLARTHSDGYQGWVLCELV